MQFRNLRTPAKILPAFVKEKIYHESWQKGRIGVAVRDHDSALAIKTRPLPYMELLFSVTNNLPVDLQVYGASVELWLGKPILQFYTFLSEQLRPGETRDTLRAVTFPNHYQMELLNPDTKSSLPPNVTVVLTASCRSSLGLIEKTVKANWLATKIIA